ncbi:deoxyribonuclease IV [Aneurinibacillus sp. Ricciae_BoGa-3]|uniref:deoxyribonuclease IV n=1 Tax=Aneurinibacillus sp. Ricciae_BoGa-3 TaxID=3022697 RepID=UPI00233F818D|nr:deoxyribonuclease IV [Aneurinibacillus sp. Ricciae_BoGa-3]WCK56202.1 deoxyribonuclease IV [Aneurinibacillus sp. Ricciae_BoGa-3]
MKIGSHVSFSKKGLLNAVQEAVSYGSTSFMIYTGAPQNTRRKPMEQQYVEEGLKVMREHGIDDIVVHAPYIINLASFKNHTFELAVSFLRQEIERAEFIGVKNIVLHPGAFTEKDAEYGINRIAEGLNEVLHSGQKTNIALETMAGKGSEMGRTFEELASIIEKVELNEKLTVCFDTCHTHDAGYDVVYDFDGVMEQFDRVVGLDRLAVFHINDSKNFRGAAKDRHAPVGSGLIGFDAINYIVHHEAARDKPVILETPWIGKNKEDQSPMYEVEIALLRGNLEERFTTNFLGDVEQLNAYFAKQGIDRKEFVQLVWQKLLDKKFKKEDPREPLERLYDMVVHDEVLPDESEEGINKRITAWLSGTIK